MSHFTPSAGIDARSRPASPARGLRVALRRRRDERGIMLVDCLVYIAVWLVVTGLAFSAFYRTLDYTRQLDRVTGDIARALQTGERWLEDIRRASAPPHEVRSDADGLRALHIPQGTNEVVYLFLEGTIYRQAQTNAPWAKLLEGVQSSSMLKDQRTQVAAWRWELALKSRQKNPRVQPLFSFGAVAAQTPKP